MLSLALEGHVEHPASPVGLHYGFGGLAFVAALLKRPGSRDYDAIMAHCLVRVAQERDRPGFGGFGEYDIISGISGSTIAALVVGKTGVDAEAQVDALAGQLIELAESSVERGRSSRFYLEPEDLATSMEKSLYPSGYVNVGLAHGIPGPLVALAGAAVDFDHAAAREMSILLGKQMIRSADMSAGSARWAGGVNDDGLSLNHGERGGWCYGTPGSSRALFVFGRAVGDQEAVEVATAAGRELARRVLAGHRLRDASLCHGVAGVGQVLARFYNDTGDELFREAGAVLIEELCDRFHQDLATGFLDYIEDEPFSGVGLLDGAVGIVLSLLAAVESTSPSWDAALGISLPIELK